MRSSLTDFRVLTPKTRADALKAMSARPAPVPIAGGTDIMVLLNAGHLPPTTLLDLHAVREFSRPLKLTAAELQLNALTTYMDVRRNREVCRRYPLLPLAAREIGAIQIQTRGTWAGNIANASPAADGVPVLMAYDAEVELMSSRGTRRVRLADFYKGYKQMDKKSDELISRIIVPRPASGTISYFRKVGTRKFQAISKVLLTGLLRLDRRRRVEHTRIILASVMPYTFRARKTEAALEGAVLDRKSIDRALKTLSAEIKPIDDIRSTALYRKTVALNLLREFLARK